MLTDSLVDKLIEDISNRSIDVGVIGLGYVGLPLAIAFAERQFQVTGFDIDAEKPEQISMGHSYFVHIADKQISSAVNAGFLRATTDFSRISDMNVVVICVPTPLRSDDVPDLQYIESTARVVAEYLCSGQLIVLESTTYPGTTREVLIPILEESGLKSGEDFFVAYSPEREDPGAAGHSTQSIPKIVGADGESALKITLELYDTIVPETVPVSSVDVAEAAKLTENIFRAVNIALVNELKLVFDGMSIDIWEVISAAKTKPFGYMPFYPGPGLGGHCIPIDPFYLSWRAQEMGLETRFVQLAGEINTKMPAHVVSVLSDEVAMRGGDINTSHILMLGIAYKKNVDDVRESPGFRLMDLLVKRGAKVDFHDPFVSEIPQTRDYPEFTGMQSVELTEDSIKQYQAVLICTDHDTVDYALVVSNACLVIDTRNATKDFWAHGDNIVKA